MPLNGSGGWLARTALIAGAAVLAVVWFGPLRDLARESFAAHMTIHMSVVAIAAPLLASSVAASRYDPVRVAPALFGPIVASMIEFLLVSAWHTPALHHAARTHGAIFALEQLSFLGSGLLLWLSAAGGSADVRGWRSAAGAGALLFTSMHMTLLGALFALTRRPLYDHHNVAAFGLTPLDDQHLGGVVMLLVGGISYLAGGLWMTARTLRPRYELR